MITKLQALQESMILWDDMAETGSHNKMFSKVWARNGGTIPDRKNDCPCCEYVKECTGGNPTHKTCKSHCPAYALWGNQTCVMGDSIYEKWTNTTIPYVRKHCAAEIAQGLKKLYEEELQLQKEKKDIRPFEVGETVYDDVFQKFGRVLNTQHQAKYPILVEMSGITASYKIDGKLSFNDARHRLHHADEVVDGKIVIEVPPQPKQRIKKLVWQNFRKCGDSIDLMAGYCYDTEKQAMNDAPNLKNYIGTFSTEIEVEE